MEGLRFEVSRIAVIEKPPICRTVLVEEENIVRPYYLAFPWQVFVINKIGYMGEHWLNDLYLGFRNTSMTQEDQMLCWPNLWNVYNNLCVCYPTINKEKGTKGIEEFYKGVLNDFWSSVWRLSRGLHVGYKHCYAPGLRDITGPDWKLWQEKPRKIQALLQKSSGQNLETLTILRNFTMTHEKQYTNIQPKDGEPVIHCGHLRAKKCHFFKVTAEPIKFCRPDGTWGKAEWIVACDACWEKANGIPDRILIHGDGTWIGDEPVIEENDDSGQVFKSPKIDPRLN